MALSETQIVPFISIKYCHLNPKVTTRLNQKWVADITYIHTLDDGWCYLSTIMDLHSRKIIGYHFDRNMTTVIV